MTGSRLVTSTGLVASVAAITVTALAAGGIHATLEGAYTYPNSQGLSLDDAASMTMTYLFAIGGAGLIVSLIYLQWRRLATSRAGWWIGAVLTAVALAIATYNATQAFPMEIKAVYFLPAAAGLFWLVASRASVSTPVAARV